MQCLDKLIKPIQRRSLLFQTQTRVTLLWVVPVALGNMHPSSVKLLLVLTTQTYAAKIQVMSHAFEFERAGNTLRFLLIY